MLQIGTRGSHLATTQSAIIRDLLISAGHEAELSIVTTPGDLSQAPVEHIGVGVFTAALREALFRGEVDIAVHSFKDLPTADEPLAHLIVPVREDNREALIARDDMGLHDLPQGAKVGTSAPRRVAQLKALRPDLDILPLRGNIDTRIRRVHEEQFDAIVLAYAGLKRAGRGEEATEVFDPADFIPAPAQGALAVECRSDDAATRAALDPLLDESTAVQVAAERSLLAALEAGCTAPVGARASYRSGTVDLTAGVFSTDGTQRLISHDSVDVSGRDAAAVREAARVLGRDIAGRLLANGAAELMA